MRNTPPDLLSCDGVVGALGLHNSYSVGGTAPNFNTKAEDGFHFVLPPHEQSTLKCVSHIYIFCAFQSGEGRSSRTDVQIAITGRGTAIKILRANDATPFAKSNGASAGVLRFVPVFCVWFVLCAGLVAGSPAVVTDTKIKENEEDTKTNAQPTLFYTNIATCIFFRIYFLLPYHDDDCTKNIMNGGRKRF